MVKLKTIAKAEKMETGLLVVHMMSAIVAFMTGKKKKSLQLESSRSHRTF